MKILCPNLAIHHSSPLFLDVYDEDHNGVIKGSELKELCADVIRRDGYKGSYKTVDEFEQFLLKVSYIFSAVARELQLIEWPNSSLYDLASYQIVILTHYRLVTRIRTIT